MFRSHFRADRSVSNSAKPTRGASALAATSLLAIILLAGGLRWGNSVLEHRIKPDETVYVSAAAYLAAGQSPYEESIYFYPPLFAYFAAELSERYGELGYLKIQRAVNLAGICVATWLSVLIAGWRWWPALATAVAWLWLSPVVALPIQIGNAAGLPAALILLALWCWLRQPLASGAALGFGLVLKPLAPLVPLLLLAYRGADDRRSALLASGTAIGTGGLLLLVGWRFLPGILENATGSPTQPYNFSLHRILAGLGLDLRPIWLLVAIGLLAAAWMTRAKLSRRGFLIAVIGCNLVAAPILWAHSLLLLLPVQLLAIDRLARWLKTIRRQTAQHETTWRHVLAGLALVSTVLTASVGGLGQAPSWLQSCILAVPFLAIPYLAIYALKAPNSRPR